METVALVMIAAMLVMGFTDSAIPDQKETGGVIHVGGKVLCQDCTQGWNEWAHGGNPIKGSKVSITCMDERNRVVHYASDMTDELGKFDIIANEFNINGKKLKTELCWVRLVSSPHPTCNIPTDFSGGQRGVKLSLPTLVYRDQTEYTLGPFYFTSQLCDEPDTNHNSDDPQGIHY